MLLCVSIFRDFRESNMTIKIHPNVKIFISIHSLFHNLYEKQTLRIINLFARKARKF